MFLTTSAGNAITIVLVLVTVVLAVPFLCFHVFRELKSAWRQTAVVAQILFETLAIVCLAWWIICGFILGSVFADPHVTSAVALIDVGFTLWSCGISLWCVLAVGLWLLRDQRARPSGIWARAAISVFLCTLIVLPVHFLESVRRRHQQAVIKATETESPQLDLKLQQKGPRDPVSTVDPETLAVIEAQYAEDMRLFSLKGSVLAVYPNGLMEVSIGSRDGLRKHQVLYVCRSEDDDTRHLGQVRVTKIAPDKSICEALTNTDGWTAQTGDHVVASMNAFLGEPVRIADEIRRVPAPRSLLETVKQRNQDPREQEKQLSEMWHRMSDVMARQRVEGETASEVSAAAKLEGVVLNVASTGLIEVSTGSDGGLRKGNRLHVDRIVGAQRLHLGQVEVVVEMPGRALCRILPGFRKGGIQRGDRVTSQPE